MVPEVGVVEHLVRVADCSRRSFVVVRVHRRGCCISREKVWLVARLHVYPERDCTTVVLALVWPDSQQMHYLAHESTQTWVPAHHQARQGQSVLVQLPGTPPSPAHSLPFLVCRRTTYASGPPRRQVVSGIRWREGLGEILGRFLDVLVASS
jgi:hypothetical protein